MGYTIFFYTDTDAKKPKFMTLAEIKAGVKAIEEVAKKRSSEFEIRLKTQTKIEVAARSDNPVETFVFAPKSVRKGKYVLEFSFCKTNLQSEDAGIKEMILALQKAVHNKLYIKPTPNSSDW